MGCDVGYFAVTTSFVEPLEKLIQLQSDLLAIDADTRLTDVLKAIAEAANNVLGGHFCAVQPYDEASDRFIVEQFTPGGAPEAKSFTWRAPREHGMARSALEKGLLVVEDYDRYLDDYEFLTQGPAVVKGAFRDVADIKASLAVRLEAGGEKVGVLSVNYPRPHHFSSEEIRIAAIFANQAALAIRNVRLYENLVNASNNLRESSEQLEQLLSLVREIDEWIAQRGGDKTALADFTLRRFLELFQFEAAWIQLMEGQRLLTVATDPKHIEDTGRLTRLDDSITGLAATSGRSVKIDDLDTAEPSLQELYKPVHGAGMRSELAVPMRVENRVIGVLNLESSQPGAFSAADRALLEMLARHLSVAIVAAEEMQQRAALGEMAIEFSGSLEEDETARSILDRALKLIGGQFGQIVMRDGDLLEVTYATRGEGIGMRVAVDDCASGLSLLPPDDPYLKSHVESGAVFLRGRSVIIPDVDRVDRYKRVIEADKERMYSELAIPVEVNGVIVGVFNVESPLPGAFDAKKEWALVNFVQLHARQIAQALHRRSTPALGELMQQGLKLVHEEFGQILRRDGEHLVIEHTEGDEPAGTKVQIRRLSSGQWAPVSGRAVMLAETVNVPDVTIDPGYERFLGAEMKSELIVPLVAHGETIGVINLESPVPGYFTEEHVQLLESMASHAAAAMANARAARERELAAVGELSGDIVHRLSNPTGAVRWRIELLREKRADLLASDEYLARSLADMDRNTKKIQEMVRELKERAPESLAPFAPWPLLMSALRRLDLPKNVQVVTKPDGRLPRVICNRKLEDVFYNLLANAVEAMPAGGALEISAGLDGDDWVAVSIRDTGRGIPEYLLTEIFVPAFTTKQDEGHGLGLWWSRAFVEKCGGTIRVESKVGEGSCFIVRLRSVG
jgi:GAF domain-containing protein